MEEMGELTKIPDQRLETRSAFSQGQDVHKADQIFGREDVLSFNVVSCFPGV